MVKDLKNFFALLPLYWFDVRTVLYFCARWFITSHTLIETILPRRGIIIDLGCGEGMLANLLALRAPARTVIGFDFDERRLAKARRAALRGKITNATFHIADALTYPLSDDIEAIVVYDVLHHISERADQEFLIKRIANKLLPGRFLIIREPVNDDRIKGPLNSIADRYLFYPGTAIAMRTVAEWTRLLKKNGFSVTAVRRTNHLSPFSARLLVAQKR